MGQLRCLCSPQYSRGQHFDEFIGYWFGQCVYTARDYVGFIMGWLNLMIWFYLYIPQLWSNYKTRSKGLNPFMLSLWVFGDLTGLLGLIMTNQGGLILGTQCYYLMNDVAMLSQWFWYNVLNKEETGAESPVKHQQYVDSEDYRPDPSNTDTDVRYSSSLVPGVVDGDLGSVQLNSLPQSDSFQHRTSHSNGSFSTNGAPAGEGSLFSKNNKTTSSNSIGKTTTTTTTFSPGALPLTTISESSPNPNQVQSEVYMDPFLIDPATATLTEIQSQAATKGGGRTNNSSMMSPQTLILISLTILSIMAHPAAAKPISALASNLSQGIDSVLDSITSTLSDGVAAIPSCTKASLEGWQRSAGIFFAWVCTAIYSPSRIPQVVTNYKRKSTYGLSPQFIFITFFAYTFYSGSILIPTSRYDATNGFRAKAFWVETFPYLLSIIFAAFFNITIFIQMYIYRERTRADAVGVELTDKEAEQYEQMDREINGEQMLLGHSTSMTTRSKFVRTESVI